jgi:hypothetical protein
MLSAAVPMATLPAESGAGWQTIDWWAAGTIVRRADAGWTAHFGHERATVDWCGGRGCGRGGCCDDAARDARRAGRRRDRVARWIRRGSVDASGSADAEANTKADS